MLVLDEKQGRKLRDRYTMEGVRLSPRASPRPRHPLVFFFRQPASKRLAPPHGFFSRVSPFLGPLPRFRR